MENETDYKCDANGDIDINYYMHEAEQMRAECISQLFAAFKSWLHDSTHNLADKLFSHHNHLPH
jgi:hypothetical protein